MKMGGKLSLSWFRNQDDPDGAWKQQNREQEHNKMYRFVNIAQKGDLIDVYINEGERATKAFIRNKIEPWLSNGGKGMTVSRADYIRWKCKKGTKMKKLMDTNCAHVLDEPFALMNIQTDLDSKTDEALLKEHPEEEGKMIKIPDSHEVCWNINNRGVMGETLLHLLTLFNSEMSISLAKILVEMYPKMVNDYYEDDEYYGEIALHLAIIHGNLDMVKLLVENGSNVNQRACGRFFLPEDQKKKINIKKTNYTGYAYYGEYPLAFAASCGQEEIYNYLINNGAEPDVKDYFGNTVLHMMVIANQKTMFASAVKHPVKKADIEILNGQGLTSLSLASKLGRHEIFMLIIELGAVEIWSYSNVTCSMYPLRPLDTIGPGGKTNLQSSLIYITDGDTPEHFSILEGGVIRQLLDEKWTHYAKKSFFRQAFFAVVYIILFSTAIYTRPLDGSPLISGTDTQSVVRYICEILVILYCIYTFAKQIPPIKNQGIGVFLKGQKDAVDKLSFNIACLLTICCVPVRICQADNMEKVLLSIAAPFTWFYLLFFARGIILLGPFVIMIYKMIMTDILRFVAIFVVFLLLFSQCFYSLYKDIEDDNITVFKTFFGTIMMIIQMTFGEFKYDYIDSTRNPSLTKMVFFIFAVIVPILLLNMLIAMMGNTYGEVIERSVQEWKRQRAKIIINLETSFGGKELLKFQDKYTVPMAGSDPPEPALMVIKTCLKTKARIKKAAVLNWRKLFKRVKKICKAARDQGVEGPILLENAEQYLKKVAVKEDGEKDALDQAYEVNFMAATEQLIWEQDIDASASFNSTTDNIQNEEKEEVTEMTGIDNPSFNYDKLIDPEESADSKTEQVKKSSGKNKSKILRGNAVSSLESHDSFSLSMSDTKDLL